MTLILLSLPYLLSNAENTYYPTNPSSEILLFAIFLNSIYIITIDTIPAIKSAIGPEYIIPSIPINNGNIIIKGNKNNICLVSERNIPFFGFPIAVKKFEDIGCKQFMNVNNKNILKYFIAKA